MRLPAGARECAGATQEDVSPRASRRVLVRPEHRGGQPPHAHLHPNHWFRVDAAAFHNSLRGIFLGGCTFRGGKRSPAFPPKMHSNAQNASPSAEQFPKI